MSSDEFDDDDETPVSAIDSERMVLEANLLLAQNENERLRLEVAALQAQAAEQDRLIAKLKLELRHLMSRKR